MSLNAIFNINKTISSQILPKDAAMQVDIGLPYLEDVESSECSDIDSDEQMC